MAGEVNVSPERLMDKKVMIRLKRKLTNRWRDLGIYLGIPYEDLENIERNHKNSIEEKAYQMLLHWQRTATTKATVKTLVERMRKLKLNLWANEIERLHLDQPKPKMEKTVLILQFQEVLFKVKELVSKHWKDLGRVMDLEESELEKIDENHSDDVEEKANVMLQFWLNLNDGATVADLAGYLRDIARNDIAHEIEKLVTDHHKLPKAESVPAFSDQEDGPAASKPKVAKLKTSRPIQLSPQMELYDENTHYNMNHKKRGHAIIFLYNCHEDPIFGHTSGSKTKNKNKLMKTLIHLNFEETMIHVFKEFSKQQICQYLSEVAVMDHTDNDCLMVVICSHGDKKIPDCRPDCPKSCLEHNEKREYLCLPTGEMETELLWAPFTPTNAPTLKGKPKLFFVQACRGGEKDPGAAMDFTDNRSTFSAAPSKKFSSDVDFLIAHSSTSGKVSFTKSGEGSWFIQVLCDYLLADGHNDDLLSILTKVTDKVNQFESYVPDEPALHQMKQTVETVLRLRKKVLFKPK